MLISCAGVAAAHKALGLGPEFLGPGLEGLVDLGLMVVGALLMSLSDREYFWAIPPKPKRAKGRSRLAP